MIILTILTTIVVLLGWIFIGINWVSSSRPTRWYDYVVCFPILMIMVIAETLTRK